MNGMWKRISLSLGLAMALLVSGVPLKAQSLTGGVGGIAKDENGKPLVGYLISIEQVGTAGKFKTKVNKKGEYTYIGLRPGLYKVTLQSPDGKDIFSVEAMVQQEYNMEVSYVDFNLQKERQAQKSDPKYQDIIKKQEEAQAKGQKLKQQFELGVAYMQQNNYDAAVTAFEQALQTADEKNKPVITAHLAEAYSKGRKYDLAAQTFQKAMELAPGDANLHNSYGSMLAQSGKLKEAEAEFKKAAEMNPAGAAMYYFNLGAVLYNQGSDMDAATTAFQECVKLDPNRADAYFLMAQGLTGKATVDANGKVVPPPGLLEALDNYLKLEPNGKYAASAKQMRDSMTGKVETGYKKQPKKKS